MYDSSNNGLPGDGRMSAVEVRIILKVARQAVARFRCAPQNVNLAESMTKSTGARLAPLIDLIDDEQVPVDRRAGEVGFAQRRP